LDVDRMNKACEILLQHTNFQSFSKARANVTHFHCKLDFAYWKHTNDDCLTFHIKADRFLWGMVRTIVGTMLEIGQDRMSLDQFEQIILARDRTVAGRAAPANGLYLVAVGYPAAVFENRA
ncbi:MAG: tRNA pseudouridine(38-40) synthase TruA, partial [Pedobacter sp.]